MSSETVATLGLLIRVPFVFLFTYAAGHMYWDYSLAATLIVALWITTLWEMGR